LRIWNAGLIEVSVREAFDEKTDFINNLSTASRLINNPVADTLLRRPENVSLTTNFSEIWAK
jgi:hypothetical protein